MRAGSITPCHPVPHTIVLPGADHGGEGDGQGAGRTRLHAVRGHFATYTPEAPLFGKLVGTCWRPWHLSGNPERGIIESDTGSGPTPRSTKPTGRKPMGIPPKRWSVTI